MPKKRILQDRGVIRVTFELPAEVKGRTAHLVGDFTSWKGVPMERRKEGGWHTSVDLEPGRSYEFRYMIDGARWENDWAADRYVRNPFGHENSVVETPALPAGTVDAGTPAPAKTAAPKKAAARKATPAKKAAATKSPVKKAAAKKGTAKKTTAKTPASAPKKAAAKKSSPGTSATGREQDGAKGPEGDNRGS